MTNKLVPVDIVQTRPCFDGKSPHWLSMGMENLQLFQLGMRMSMGCTYPATILVPVIFLFWFKLLKYSQLIK